MTETRIIYAAQAGKSAAGGMQNPFALLLLAPVTVSATILSLGSTICLCLLALGAASLLTFSHLPLPWQESGIALPDLYLYGIWLALVIAIIFIAAYTWRVAEEARRMTDSLVATQKALAQEKQLSAIGGLAAAAAHELGSPLSTIAVIAADLSREVPTDSEFAADIELLRSESGRCRDILKDLSRRPDLCMPPPLARVPMSTLIELAAASHDRDEIEVIVERQAPEMDHKMAETTGEPLVPKSPEILHSLGTLLQNAIQFAKSTVEVAIEWDQKELVVAIEDDGPGFPPPMLELVGEPYISSRRATTEHMGLGIFIAKTLIESSGGRLYFGNRREGGARAEARWIRAILDSGAQT